MKSDIHPTYYKEAKVTCACGNTFTTGSTQESIQVEVCSNCHPFYTGKQNLIDTAGRVERYQRLLSKKKTAAPTKATKRTTAKAAPEAKTDAA